MNHRFERKLRRFVEEVCARLGIADPRIIDALSEVPRHLFVDEAFRLRVYTDDALPIGYGQTISKVSTVARMTAALDPRPEHRILEIGTGSGYQAAVLARLCREVYSVERLPALSVKAQNLLHRVGAFNVKARSGDGTLGWPEAAPFDRIIVTAAADRLPQTLYEQLAVGGRLVAPEDAKGGQVLRLIVRGEEGWERTDLETCRFVPLVRHGGR